MKKFGMFIFTILIISFTIFLYFYQTTDLPDLKYKEPEVNFTSEKYGKFEDMEWFLADKAYILFTANKDNITTLYIADKDTGKVQELFKYTPHTKLKDIEFSKYMHANLYTFSPESINEINLVYDDKHNFFASSNIIPILDFKDSNSTIVSGQIYFTKQGSRTMYAKNNAQSSFFFSNNFSNDLTSIYLPISRLCGISSLSGDLYYTNLEKDSLRLYSLKSGHGKLGYSKKLLSKNVVYTRQMVNSYYDSILYVTDNGSNYSISIDKINQNKAIDSIPKNTDLLGQIPDVQYENINNKCTIIYTKFDLKGNGFIFANTSYGVSQLVVENLPIVGPLRLAFNTHDILFFTVQNGKTKIKTCSFFGKDIKDITNIFE